MNKSASVNRKDKSIQLNKRDESNFATKKSTNIIKKTIGLKKEEKKTTHKRSYKNFSRYIFKVLKGVHNEIGISKKSVDIMNSFLYDIYDRLALEASKLVRYNKKNTLSAREIQSAVKLLLPGELAKHAIIEGSKAINKFASDK